MNFNRWRTLWIKLFSIYLFWFKFSFLRKKFFLNRLRQYFLNNWRYNFFWWFISVRILFWRRFNFCRAFVWTIRTWKITFFIFYWFFCNFTRKFKLDFFFFNLIIFWQLFRKWILFLDFYKIFTGLILRRAPWLSFILWWTAKKHVLVIYFGIFGDSNYFFQFIFLDSINLVNYLIYNFFYQFCRNLLSLRHI